MNIAIVTAHPDDAEYLAGGTIVKYIQKGHKVTIVICTNGNVGSAELTNDEIAKVRLKESQEAAKILGAELITLGYDDEFMQDNKQTRLAILNALRKVTADIVFTHYPFDHVNIDHLTVGNLTTYMSYLQMIKNIETEYSETEKPAALYYMDVLSGGSFQPTDFVDITEVFEIKKEALLKHKSQYLFMQRTGTAAFTKDGNGKDFTRNMEIMAQFRGMQNQTVYAEAFIFSNRYPRAKEKNLLPQYL